jgi:hypothetical protein
MYFYEVTDSLDISYFLSSKSNQDIISDKDIISNYDIVPYISYSYLTAIFLLGLFSSLCAFTFCCTSKKTVPKYIIVQ